MNVSEVKEFVKQDQIVQISDDQKAHLFTTFPEVLSIFSEVNQVVLCYIIKHKNEATNKQNS